MNKSTIVRVNWWSAVKRPYFPNDERGHVTVAGQFNLDDAELHELIQDIATRYEDRIFFFTIESVTTDLGDLI